ncbi:MAG: hypothetical protein A2Z29_04210 [Chloroflexi bacterium RBG_16_56_11]|nr:MAG: hypothetical protein A2Z29_04210 [Chloroflexi bacterium RBG_16_56_11]
MSPAAVRSFRAKIGIAGINPYVDVPARVSRAFARRGPVPVKGALNGHPIQATLVPTGGGRHRLYINIYMRKATGVKVGDEIRLELEYDDRPRELPVPKTLKEALERNRKAGEVFARLPPSHRNEYLAYLNSLKTPEALARNIEKVIASLLKQKPRR